jgi:hypothetical protein
MCSRAAALFPDIGPSVAAAGLGRAVLVGKPLVVRVGLAGRGVSDQPVQVFKEGLRVAALVSSALPFLK